MSFMNSDMQIAVFLDSVTFLTKVSFYNVILLLEC